MRSILEAALEANPVELSEDEVARVSGASHDDPPGQYPTYEPTFCWSDELGRMWLEGAIYD
ncbi:MULTISPECIES: hypothetical protein [Euryhalocaulis]|uniref:hypothetical protein n=1 Tax=Euryhalocaulis TaxID=1712422 RepID=UPI0003B491D6|nr:MULTISPECIES: hypothetical protein [Euryhalocaulis]MBA4801340.1 hypothetical protein [Euryhalocaulis sp.]